MKLILLVLLAADCCIIFCVPWLVIMMNAFHLAGTFKTHQRDQGSPLPAPSLPEPQLLDPPAGLPPPSYWIVPPSQGLPGPPFYPPLPVVPENLGNIKRSANLKSAHQAVDLANVGWVRGIATLATNYHILQDSNSITRGMLPIRLCAPDFFSF